MRYFIPILCAAGLLAGCAANHSGSSMSADAIVPASEELATYASFGAPVKTTEVMTLASAVEGIEMLAEKPVTVVAEIEDVCAKAGCWLILKDGDKQARVRFTTSDECADGWFVPRNSAGHKVLVTGTLAFKDVPEDWARHYAEDAGKSPEEIALIVGPQREISMIATGIMISEGGKLDPPIR